MDHVKQANLSRAIMTAAIKAVDEEERKEQEADEKRQNLLQRGTKRVSPNKLESIFANLKKKNENR